VLTRMLLTGIDTNTTEEQFRAFMKSIDKQMLGEAICGSKAIQNRPKPGRLSGFCYRASHEEYLATGNPMVIGWEGVVVGDSYMTIMPHAFNFDKKTKTYYDTASNYHKLDSRRAVWPLVSGNSALARIQASEDFSETYGGFVFVLWKGVSYTIRTYGLTGSGTRRNTLKCQIVL